MDPLHEELLSVIPLLRYLSCVPNVLVISSQLGFDIGDTKYNRNEN